MKKQIPLFLAGLTLISFSVLSAFTSAGEKTEEATGIKWYDIETAQKLSDSIPRRIFIDFSTSWCGWCKKMDAETFANPVIAKYMDEHYYCVKFDAESRDTISFNGQTFYNRGPVNSRSAHDFAVTVLRGQLSYPSYAIFDKPRTHITILQGYMPAENFEPYLHYYAEEKDGVMTYQEFLQTFKSELPKKQEAPKPAGPPQY